MLWPLRIAITGRAATPGGAFEMAYLIGKGETMKRLDDAMAKLEPPRCYALERSHEGYGRPY